MKFVVALEGEESEKYFNGKTQKVIPFVGANDKDVLGIGLIAPEYNGVVDFYGLIFPHRIIQSWRAMKLLEPLPAIEKEVLTSCWYLAGKETPHRRYVQVLSAWLDSEEYVLSLRQDIRKLVPSDNDLGEMINSFRKNKLNISLSEIQDEVKAGKLTPSPRIQILLAKLNAA